MEERQTPPKKQKISHEAIATSSTSAEKPAQATKKESGGKKKGKWTKKKVNKTKQKNEQRNHLEELQSNWKDALILIQNLPNDVQREEIVSFASKCGVIRKNPQSKEAFIFLDTTSLALPQAILSFFRPESVTLAVDLLDGAPFRDSWNVNVSPYPSEKLTEEQIAALAPPQLKGLSNKVKLYDQSTELSWEEDENRIIVLKHMFSLDDVDWSDAPKFFEELEREIWQECTKYGPIDVLKIFENHPDGVVAIKFKESRSAQDCLAAVDGRWFGGKRIEAHHYDGWTDYSKQEISELTEKRIQAFGSWLEDGDEEESKQQSSSQEKKERTEE